ncbi:MAG: septum formation initiator family protein [bacterium]
MKKYSTKNRKSKRKNNWYFLPWFIIVLFFTLFYIKQGSDIYQQGYELVKVKKMYKETKEIENYLKLKVIKLKSPNQIEKDAKEKCDLIRSNEEEIILLTVKDFFEKFVN